MTTQLYVCDGYNLYKVCINPFLNLIVFLGLTTLNNSCAQHETVITCGLCKASLQVPGDRKPDAKIAFFKQGEILRTPHKSIARSVYFSSEVRTQSMLFYVVRYEPC